MFVLKYAPSDFLTRISNWLKSFPSSPNQESTFRNVSELFNDVYENYAQFNQEFEAFLKEQSNPTVTFWAEEVRTGHMSSMREAKGSYKYLGNCNCHRHPAVPAILAFSCAM